MDAVDAPQQTSLLLHTVLVMTTLSPPGFEFALTLGPNR